MQRESVLPVEAAWGRIRRWCAAYAPAALDAMNPPVVQEDLFELEDTLGCAIPSDYRRFLEIHDGDDDEGPLPLQLMPVADVLQTRRQLQRASRAQSGRSRAAPGLRDAWFRDCWIPITRDGGLNHYCLDLNPGRGGRVGQVLLWSPSCSDRPVVAQSFTELLSLFADALDAGAGVAVASQGSFFRVMRRADVCTESWPHSRGLVRRLIRRKLVVIEPVALPAALTSATRALENLPHSASSARVARVLHTALSDVEGVRVIASVPELTREITGFGP